MLLKHLYNLKYRLLSYHSIMMPRYTLPELDHAGRPIPIVPSTSSTFRPQFIVSSNNSMICPKYDGETNPKTWIHKYDVLCQSHGLDEEKRKQRFIGHIAGIPET